MDQAKAPKMARAEAEKAEVGDKDAPAVPDEDVGHLAAAVDEKAQLPPRLPRQHRKAPRRLEGDHLPKLGFQAAEPFDAVNLAGLEAGCFALDPGYGVSSLGVMVTSLWVVRKG